MKMADIVLFSNAIFDSVKDEPFPGGVAICGEKIELIGTKEAVRKLIGTNTIVRDFGDQLIMPGFCDGHIHLEGASNRFCAPKVQGLSECKSEAECLERVLEFSREHPDAKRITGIGWALNYWGFDAPPPSKHSLDKYFPDTPVYLQATDGHTGWINSAAMKECDLEGWLADNPDKDTPLLAPREEDGSLSGFLKEGPACYPFFFSIKVTPEEYAQYAYDLFDMCCENGITGFTDLTMTKFENLPAFLAPVKRLDNDGKLTVRFHMWPGLFPGQDPEDLENIKPYLDLYNTDMLHISGFKSVLDGISESQTAAMLEPYESDPTTCGTPAWEQEALNANVIKANQLGLSVKIHSIGDKSVRMALDAYEASGKVNDMTRIRNGVEHMEIVSDADVPRFAEIGAIASFQPAHEVLGAGFAEKNLGMERFKHEFRWRDVLKYGAHYSLGTDAPVVELSPYISIYKAVTRLDVDGTQYSPYTTDQNLTLVEALKGYTVESNYATAFEDKCGTLEAGKYADIVVWDKNPFAIDPMEIKDCCTAMTICNGRIVYEKK